MQRKVQDSDVRASARRALIVIGSFGTTGYAGVMFGGALTDCFGGG
jgi:hypothetical protein